jgi:hypothetical protein
MVAPFRAAFGDSPVVALPAAATVVIAPGDTWDVTNPDYDPSDVGILGSGTGSNAVDTNRVAITGSGTIGSFGQANGGQPDDKGNIVVITKRVDFRPDAGKTIILHHNAPGLVLLGAADRTIGAVAHGEYQSDTSGNWTETRFTQSTQAPTTHGGQLIATTYLPGTSTITIPPLATRAWVRMWGGSGASGAGGVGQLIAGYPNGSPGTGSGGYLEKFLTGLTPGNTLTYTRGNGGAATTGTGGNGSASTLASGTQTIATLTANGSNGTPASGGGLQSSTGGTATGGDVNQTGQMGGLCVPIYQFNAQSNSLDTIGQYPSAGGRIGLASGVDGVITSPGNPGNPGGLIIFWYNDFVA